MQERSISREGGREERQGRRERWREVTYNFMFFWLEGIAVLYMYNCSLQTQEKVRNTADSMDYQRAVHSLSRKSSDPVER